jgi:hypothetical protein
VAHISVGDQQFEASWQKGKGTWDVQPAARNSSDLPLMLLSVDQPVARLPAPDDQDGPELVSAHSQQLQSSISLSSIQQGTLHRVKLLLQLAPQADVPSFYGSDESAAAAEGGAPGQGPDAIVQCVARGCWGTCLPVAVAEVEEVRAADVGATIASDGTQHARPGAALTTEDTGSYVLLTVSAPTASHMLHMWYWTSNVLPTTCLFAALAA